MIATDLVADKLQGLQGQDSIKLDVRSQDDIEALAADVAREFGALDILVNCAGYVHQGTVLRLLRQGLGFFVRPQRQIHAPHDQDVPAGDAGEEKPGSIVNISSAVSSIRGVPNRYAYGATKAAVIGLTKAVAADFIQQGIRCNAICPGHDRIAVARRAHRGGVEARPDSRRTRCGRISSTASRWAGSAPPKEVAWLALFLASDEASYITGQTHLVDGGMAL